VRRGQSTIDVRVGGLRRLPGVVAGVAFVTYWLATIAYVAPNNYIRAQFVGVFRAVEPVLYQRWEFFAPPPTFNTTVYAIARLQNPEETVTWDLTSEVRRLKGRHAPFNATEDAIDYVLSSAATDIVEQLQQHIGHGKKTHPEAKQEVWVNEALTKMREYEPKNSSIIAIRNYAAATVAKSVLTDRPGTVRLVITYVDIPKFGYALTESTPPLTDERPMYVSADYPLPR
jgi:hypothetical protein